MELFERLVKLFSDERSEYFLVQSLKFYTKWQYNMRDADDDHRLARFSHIVFDRPYVDSAIGSELKKLDVAPCPAQSGEGWSCAPIY